MTQRNRSLGAPKRRFPEFAGQALQEVRLGDVTAESTTRNGEGLPVTSVMGVSKVLGIVPMQEHVVASDISRYKVVEKNWFAYNPMRLNIGSIARWNGDDDILVSPDYVVLRCLSELDKGIEPDYLDQFRQSIVWDHFVSEGGDGGVRVRIYYKDLALLELALPARAEQKKIAGCLTSLDEVIAAQGRKLEALKAHKLGLMQRLFPREGETRPRLRFPKFRDAPEWREKNVGDLVDTITPPKKLPTADYASQGRYPILDQSPFPVCGWTDDREAVVTSTQPVIIFGDHTCTLKLQIGPFVQGADGIKILLPGSEVTGEFLFQALQVQKLESTEYKRHFSDLKEKRVRLPSRDSGEQDSVADLLGVIDNGIVAETNQLAALKAQKQGLMQQLFPAPEGGS